MNTRSGKRLGREESESSIRIKSLVSERRVIGCVKEREGERIV